MTGRQLPTPVGIGRQVVIVAFVSAHLAVTGCKEADDAETTGLAKPTPVATAASVLRDTGGQTDNSACQVCHADLAEEEIVAAHLKASIYCASCHGASGDHGGDELNIITPDVTFGRREVEPFCKSCHPQHKMGPAYEAFVEKWQGKRRPNGRMVLANSVCTDCHGNHAILKPGQQAF